MDLNIATLDGITLEFEHLEDTFEKAIIRHEFPCRDGALLEDMGQKARVIRTRCYFWDDGDLHNTYDAHVALVNHLADRELFELIHPKYGICKGGIEQMAVRHDDRLRTAEVDLTFVENMRTVIEATPVADVEAAMEEAYAAAIDEQEDEFAADMTAALGAEAAVILGKDLDPELGIVEQFTGITLQARAYLVQVESYVTTLEATLVSIANPANSLVASISYATNLPGRVLGALSRCVERYAVLYDSITTAPERFADSFTLGLDELEAAFEGFSKTTRLAGAAHLGYRAGVAYKSDEQARAVQKKNEAVSAFDAMGKYRAPATSVAAMTVADLESSLATVRSYLQSAVDLSRGSVSLKAMALQLLTHVNTVKIQREKIIQVDLDNPMPLHLVCLMQGLPYQAADRLMAINAIRNPNCTSGRVNVYVR